MTTRKVAAVDLGADSGRVMLASYDGQHLTQEEVYRFPNRPMMQHQHRFWNIRALWDEMLLGLRKARQLAVSLDSIGVDTWGIDYGLLDENGLLLSQPYQYRDHRTDGMMERVLAHIPRETLYARTGIQFMPINTLFQLYAHQQEHPEQLAQAQQLLLIPDLLHHWLCGTMTTEQTNATTTQCWDPVAGQWVTELLDVLGIPSTMLAPVVTAGTVLGSLLPALQDELGAVRVIAPATHDTGSAIVAVPAPATANWGYISSGTWSLVGVELPQPLLSAAALNANFTNEGGVFGTTRFLKNVMGLWLLQECQRRWLLDGQMLNYDIVLAAVDDVPAFAALIDPDDARFLAPEDMPTAINSYLVEHSQKPLSAPASFARCIMESLVLRYCEVFRQLTELTHIQVDGVHIVGGGARNTRLNQWLADALGVPVIAGPYEATARGNALMQLVGLGDLHTLQEVRAIARNVPTHVYTPQSVRHAAWDEAAQRFRTIVG